MSGDLKPNGSPEDVVFGIGVEVWASARVLAEIGHLTTHLSAPEVADYTIAARKDSVAGGRRHIRR
jgi:hypothetical protein